VFTSAVYLLAIAALMHPRTTAALTSRSIPLFYGLAAAAMFIFALGPFPHAFGAPIFYQAPYAWLMRLPGGESLRVPARFAMLIALCLGQAAALAFLRVSGGRPRVAFAMLIAAAIALDGWIPKMKTAPLPHGVDLSGVDASVPVLELPARDLWDDTRAMLRAMDHRHPLVNGYSGYAPDSYRLFQEGLTKYGPVSLRTLTTRPLIIVLNHDHDADARFRPYLDTMDGAAHVRETNDVSVYLLR
jgi:hypothetical protein